MKTGDRLRDVGARTLAPMAAPGNLRHDAREMGTRTARIGGALALAASAAACGNTVRLHEPRVAPSAARADAATVDLEPIAVRPGAVVLATPSGAALAARPEAADVLTAGMRAELAGRALRGGERGGYVVRCTLDRFAVRDESRLAGAKRFATLYADLSCEVERALDHALAWRGELRGRACGDAGAAPLAREAPVLQKLVDRMTSDAAREMASDLAVRVLELESSPSARVFADEGESADRAGIDDATPDGTAALAESAPPDVVARATHEDDAAARAAAWNAIAMSAGPLAPLGWLPGGTFVADDDDRVRFFQYKALARASSAASLALLRNAAHHEDDVLLAELAYDSLAAGGIGLPRRAAGDRTQNASAVTSGTTTSP